MRTSILKPASERQGILKNQPVVKLIPLCHKWTQRGDGLEMRSAISITALLLHYLHLYKFSTCFGNNYLLSSAHGASSASALCRYLHWRHHLRLFQQFRMKIKSMRSALNILWYMRPCTLLQSSQFNHIYYFFITIFLLFRKVQLFGEQIAIHTLKLPYLPRMFCSRLYLLVTLNCVFCAVQAYSSQVLSSWLLWLASSLPLRLGSARRQPTNKSLA